MKVFLEKCSRDTYSGVMKKTAAYVISALILFGYGISLAEESMLVACERAFNNNSISAVELCRQAAEEENHYAQKIMGDIYYLGWKNALQQDHEEAVRWYKEAAVQGNIEAKYNLGVLYEQGQGVPIDFERARKWFLSAARDGHVDAQYNVANMYSKGAGGPKNQNAAAKWYLRAAEQDEPNSQYNIANRYTLELGMTQNFVEAYKWYVIAERNGIEDARENRITLAKEMTAAEINKANRLADDWRPVKEVSTR